jgi:hypothetical protein
MDKHYECYFDGEIISKFRCWAKDKDGAHKQLLAAWPNATNIQCKELTMATDWVKIMDRIANEGRGERWRPLLRGLQDTYRNKEITRDELKDVFRAYYTGRYPDYSEDTIDRMTIVMTAKVTSDKYEF